MERYGSPWQLELKSMALGELKTMATVINNMPNFNNRGPVETF